MREGWLCGSVLSSVGLVLVRVQVLSCVVGNDLAMQEATLEDDCE